jgi:hypothetical protein
MILVFIQCVPCSLYCLIKLECTAMKYYKYQNIFYSTNQRHVMTLEDPRKYKRERECEIRIDGTACTMNWKK